MLASPRLASQPPHRRAARWLVLAAALAGACRPAGTTTTPTGAPAPATADSDPLREFPRLDGAWTVADYEQARDVLVRLERERPEQLPRLDGPDGARVRKLGDLDAVAAAARGAAPDDLSRLAQALGDILQVYSARALGRADHGDEYLAVAAAFFALSAVRRERDDPGDAPDPARLQAFVEQRFHLARGVHDVLASALALPTVIAPARAAATIAAIADAVAPWFLPEERDRVLDLVDRLAGAGAAGRDLEALRRAFAPDREPHPRVDAFAEAHREYADAREAVLAQVGAGALDPVELGREGDGARWAFPDAGFSAVFPRRPNAQRHGHLAADGAAMTTRMLALEDPVHVSRAVTCTSRARPPGRSADADLRDIAAALKLRDVRAITVDGAAGLEGTLTTEAAHGLVRLVEAGDLGCVVVLEVPLARAGELAGEQRRFVDSFRLSR